MAEGEGRGRAAGGVRLTDEEVAAIRASAVEIYGPEAVVRLFGSRMRDDVRGGDVDLHVEVAEGQQDVAHAASFRWALFGRIDERKIDLVFRVRGRPLRPVDEVAIDQGVVL